MFASKHRKYKLLPLINRRVVPGLSPTFEKLMCSKFMCLSLALILGPCFFFLMQCTVWVSALWGSPILSKSIAMHLPFLSRYFCKSMPSSWQKVAYTPPTCITVRFHLYRDTFAEVLGSGVVGTPPTNQSSLHKLFGGSFFNLQLELFCLQLSFFAYSPLRCFLDTLSHCQQRSSIVSTKTQIVSKRLKP